MIRGSQSAKTLVTARARDALTLRASRRHVAHANAAATRTCEPTINHTRPGDSLCCAPIGGPTLNTRNASGSVTII